jgi:hypothetical protein
VNHEQIVLTPGGLLTDATFSIVVVTTSN